MSLLNLQIKQPTQVLLYISSVADYLTEAQLRDGQRTGPLVKEYNITYTPSPLSLSLLLIFLLFPLFFIFWWRGTDPSVGPQNCSAAVFPSTRSQWRGDPPQRTPGKHDTVVNRNEYMLVCVCVVMYVIACVGNSML